MEQSEVTLPKVPVTGIPVAEYASEGKFGISNGKKIVRVGEDRQVFDLAFPRPSRGFPLESTIPGIPKEFQSEGWETQTKGVGMVTNYNTIILLMEQFEALDTEEFAQVLELAQSACGNPEYRLESKENIDYYYAISGTEASVISRLRSPKKTYQVTVTAGDLALMKHLGIVKPFMTEGKTVAK
jgi:hypothetical protein